MSCRMGSFYKRLAEPDVSFACFAAESFARTLVIAWTHRGPRGQVPSGRKPRHVQADFGKNALGSPLADARNRTEQGHCLCPGRWWERGGLIWLLLTEVLPLVCVILLGRHRFLHASGNFITC